MKRKRFAVAVTALATTAAVVTATNLATAAPTTYPAGYKTYTCGNNSGRILITMDDKPNDHASPYTTTDMLYWGAYLKSRGVRAMFFVNDNPTATVQALRAMGHYVGNHTSSKHLKMSTLTPAQVTAEVNASVPGNMIRPPHGDYNAANKAQLADMGYRVCTWAAALSTHDWDGGTGPRGLRSVDSIRGIVRAGQNAEGGVILGHLWTNFPQALPGIIDDMHAAGKLMCRNTGPVGATVPYPLECT